MEFNINPNCQELIKSGKCKADCCGCIPLNEGYWKILKKYAQTNEYTIFRFKHNGEKFIKAITKDFKCVFVKPDFSCAIHHSHLRCEVCKIYGTDKNEPLLACPHINEDKQDFISQYSDKKMKELVKMSDPATIEYLNRKF